MLAPAIARALKHPPFDPATFTMTEWDSADDKAWFASSVVRFLLKDCPETLFTNCFYDRRHCCLGFMADCNSVHAIRCRVRASAILAHSQAEDRRELEAIERALLARLQAKYAPLPPPPRDLFDAAR